MEQERIDIFRRNLPFIVRDDGTVRRILSHPDNHFIEKRNEAGELTGLSVINRNVILLLCVDKTYRRQGTGTWLLEQSEELVRQAGYETCRAGVGFDYLMPGVPTSTHYFPAQNVRLYDGLDNSVSTFFEDRGYRHSWDNADCFDMRFDLKDLVEAPGQIGDTIQGITYRFATLADLEGILECTEDACSEFGVYYRDERQYASEGKERVLIAIKGQEVCGALMVGPERGVPGLGSIGCTTVKTSFQGQHIATNLVLLGTRALRDMGMREGYLSYTYSGLDRLYGAAGYQIKVFYMMAEKKFV
ncbi:MAG: GNAT family N-acetyltransferase [Acetatifactor sp.]|nr:GNAT family N-acetyltransferase [Acetatifactor sp.]